MSSEKAAVKIEYLMKRFFSPRHYPILIPVICVAAYGVMIPFLGFYVDDWHHLYYAYRRGLASLWELFLYDSRPFASYIYYVGFSLLGFKAISWQIANLVLRALTVFVIYKTFVDIWQGHKREAIWIALLFTVYPLFDLQPVSVAYLVHWVGFLIFWISIWAMVQSIRHPKRYLFFTFLSIITAILHLIVIEYFSGLELIRPFILWFILPHEIKPKRVRLSKTLKLWLPFLVIFIGFIFYRIFWIPRPVAGFERNELGLFIEFARSPFPTFLYAIENIFKDLVTILGSSWSKVLSPEYFGISTSVNLIVLGAIIITTIGLYFYFTTNPEVEIEPKMINDRWGKSALWIGVPLFLFGPIPGWVANLFISTENPLWSNRFGLASMLGASIIIVALLELIIENYKYRTLVVCVIIGLSVGWQINNSNGYRWSWIKQSDFYNQLLWRAPYIEPRTALLSDGEIFPNMTENSTAFAVSTLYPKKDASMELNYWFYSLYRRFNDQRKELMDGIPLNYSRFFYQFSGDSRNSLVIYYAPELNQCLWVLKAEDRDNPLVPEISSELSALSNLSRIKLQPEPAKTLPQEIFNFGLQKPWCYYFQKADLARQNNNWETIGNLWDEASDQGLKPANGVEYLPFIEGFVKTGDWETAQKMTIDASRITRRMRNMLCPIWTDAEVYTEVTPAQKEILQELYNKLECR